MKHIITKIGANKQIAQYKCQDKKCGNRLTLYLSQPNSVGTGITCLKCRTFGSMKRVR